MQAPLQLHFRKVVPPCHVWSSRRTSRWDATARYLANSPVFHLHQVTTPLLLLCGTADGLITQAEELYAGLLQLGKPATLVRYHGEGHVPVAWADDNYADYWTRTLNWFGRYLLSDAATR